MPGAGAWRFVCLEVCTVTPGHFHFYLRSNAAAASFSTGMQHRDLEEAMGRSADPAEIEEMAASLLLGGGATAKVVLAHMHREGSHGKPKDLVAAVRLYTEAAEGGSAEGMFMAGQLMLHGPPEVQDFAAGRRWLEAAARQRPFLRPGVKHLGVAESWHALGSMFRDGLAAPAPDMKQVGTQNEKRALQISFTGATWSTLLPVIESSSSCCKQATSLPLSDPLASLHALRFGPGQSSVQCRQYNSYLICSTLCSLTSHTSLLELTASCSLPPPGHAMVREGGRGAWRQCDGGE